MASVAVEVLHKCVSCKRQLPAPGNFPVKSVTVDRRGRRRKVYGQYCLQCLKEHPDLERQERRDLQVPDR